MVHKFLKAYNHLACKAFAPYKRWKGGVLMQNGLKKLCLGLVLALALLAAGILVPTASHADVENQELPAVAFFLGDLIEGT